MKIKAEDPLPGFSAACSTEQLGRKKRLDPLDLRIEHITALANKLHEERERNREDSAKKKRDRRARTKQKIEELLRKGKDLREGEKRRKEAGRKVKLKFPKQSTKEVEGIHKIKRASKKEKAKREYSNEDSLREEKKANEVSNQGGIENTPGDLHTADFLIADYDFAGLEDDDLPFLKGEVIKVLKRPHGSGGWWIGRSLISDAEGHVPSNFFRAYDISSQVIQASCYLDEAKSSSGASSLDSARSLRYGRDEIEAAKKIQRQYRRG